VISNTTYGTPPVDGNIAFDKNFNPIQSISSNVNFFEICDERRTVDNQNTCPIDEYFLRRTGYENHYGTQWKTIGGSAEPGKPFQLQMAIWNRMPSSPDAVVLIDDFQPISLRNKRRGKEYGPVCHCDLSIRLDVEYSIPSGVGPPQVGFRYFVTNHGPDTVYDCRSQFTIPKNAIAIAFDGAFFGDSESFHPALPPYQENAFHSLFLAVTPPYSPFAPGETRRGGVLLAPKPNAKDIQFRVSVISACVETDWSNNYDIAQYYEYRDDF